MKYLSIDSSSRRLLLLGVNEDKTMGVTLHNVGRHGTYLAPAVKDLLEYLQMSVKELDFIGCGIGPGSLTGLRVGISTVKGLAYPFDIPVISFCSLDLLAYNNYLSSAVVMRRGREGYYYRRKYRFEGYKPVPVEEPGFDSVDKLKSGILTKNEVLIFENEQEKEQFEGYDSLIALPPSPEIMKQIIVKAFEAGETIDVRELKPYYLQKSVAELNWERKHGKST